MAKPDSDQPRPWPLPPRSPMARSDHVHPDWGVSSFFKKRCRKFEPHARRKTRRSRGKLPRPAKKFLQRWGSARRAIFRAQIQKSESDHRSQNKNVDIKSRDFQVTATRISSTIGTSSRGELTKLAFSKAFVRFATVVSRCAFVFSISAILATFSRSFFLASAFSI